MPYKDPERQKQARRDWNRLNLRLSTGRVIQARDSSAFDIARENPGYWLVYRSYANANSAGVQAWRIRKGFYGPGLDARVSGVTVMIRGSLGDVEGAA